MKQLFMMAQTRKKLVCLCTQLHKSIESIIHKQKILNKIKHSQCAGHKQKNQNVFFVT